MILYDFAFSSAAYRVRIALALKGVAFERRLVSLPDDAHQSPEYRARNPQGFVPALAVDGTVLTQSYAIVEWLDARFPDPRLIPAEPVARARAVAMAMIVACDIHPLNNLRVRRMLERDLAIDEPARTRWQHQWMRDGFDALDAMAADGSGAGPFLGGTAPGIADVFLVPQLFNARRVALDLAPWPRLCAADAAAAEHPAFAAAHPSRVAP